MKTTKFILALIALSFAARAEYPLHRTDTTLQGRKVSSAAPTDTQVLTWSASNADWEPAVSGGSADAIPQQTGYSLTNNVTVGGTNDQLDDFTSLGVYALDAATIRNDIYQLGRFVDRIEQRLRNLGLFD